MSAPAVDAARLARAADLVVTPLEDGTWRVTGGAEPHQVDAEGTICDCPDARIRNVVCKHLYAVRGHREHTPARSTKPPPDEDLLDDPPPDDDDAWIERDSRRRRAGMPLEPSDPGLFTWFEDLRLRPELLEPPPVVIPRLVWRGRLTVLAAAEKLGKSTLAGQAVAAMQTGRRFLDGTPAKGNVLWCCLDESVSDLVQRLESFGARGGIAIRDMAPTDDELVYIVAEISPGLIVVDSLTEYLGSRRVESVYDPVQVQRALAPIRNAARLSDTAVLFLHHVAKGTGKSADSRQIGAMADVIIEMREPAGEPTEREMECRGRGMPAAYRKYRLAYERGAYELAGGAELSTEARVLLALQSESDLSKTRIRAKVGGRAEDVDRAIEALKYRGAIVDRGTASAGRYSLSGATSQNRGTGRDGVGTGVGTGSHEIS